MKPPTAPPMMAPVWLRLLPTGGGACTPATEEDGGGTASPMMLDAEGDQSSRRQSANAFLRSVGTGRTTHSFTGQ